MNASINRNINLNIFKKFIPAECLYVNPSKVKLIVFDMAGTTVDEGGVVYKTLYDVIKGNGVQIEEQEMAKFGGVDKLEVIKYFVNNRYSGNTKEKVNTVYSDFNKLIVERYFSEDATIDLIHPNLPIIFQKLRFNGIKVGLNTGYPIEIQERILNKLNLKPFIDGYTSSEVVGHGRPYPYMIYNLMEKFNITDPKEVIKVGDTKNDILEGRNAGCLMSVGVLTGAANKEDFMSENADMILENINNIKIKMSCNI